MSESTTEQKVRAIIERIGKLEPGFSGSADLFRDLGMKSVAALDLLLSLEEDFSVTIGDEQFGDARSVDALVALVEGLVGRAA